MKIIFLDFDGVLVTRRQLQKRKPEDRAATNYNLWIQGKADPECVANLKRLLEMTQAKIVVSSSWRKVKEGECPLGYVRMVLRQWGLASDLVIGTTPQLTKETVITREDGERVPFMLAKERGHEIQAWLNQNAVPDGTQLVILDDESDMVHLKHRLIQTDFEDGLQLAHIKRAARILGCTIDS